jgi:hypothetical protein
MSLEQHKRINLLLNKQVEMAQTNGHSERPTIKYEHTKEVDIFYELDQERFLALPEPIKALLERTLNPKKGVRVRVTRDLKDGHIVRQLIKHKLENLDISSPQTEWDYRIGVNLEIDYPGSVEGLNMVVDKDSHGDPLPTERKKDRISYEWLAYQIDLTQVVQGNVKNHELELELSAARLLAARDALERGGTSDFEPLVRGMLNNLRELSRRMTLPPGA